MNNRAADLTFACAEAIRLHPDSVVDAWNFVGEIFGHDLIQRLKDAPSAPPETPAYKPRTIPPERLEKRRELQHVVRSKYKNSGDVPWSDVEWGDLAGLKRDGKEATALLAAAPNQQIPNDGRTVGDVLGVKKVDEIIAAVRVAS